MMNRGEDRIMDKKQIMKIVTKRKVPILIMAFVLFVVIAFALLLNGLERRGKEQQALSMEEREQLTDMTEYLDEIDEIVTMNQEHLAEATLFQADTETVLDTFQESLSVLENDLSQIETIIQKHTETETSANSEISVSITALSENQQEIKEQITAVNTSIEAITSEIRSENKNNFITVFEKLEGLEADLANTQKDAESYYKELTKLITLLQEDNSSQYEELTNTLLTIQADIAELLKNGFEALQLQIDVDFTALMEKLDNLHGQIVDTTDSITELLMLMEENDTDRQEEIKAAFASVNGSLELIRTEYTDAHTKLQSLIQKVQETQNANHEETLSVLTVMETNMEETSLENLNQLTNSLQAMEKNFSSYISNMQGEMEQNFSTLNTGIENSFSQTNDSITKQFRELNTSISDQYQNISNQYQNISSTIINNNDSQQESLDNLISYLNQKLQEVFQYVSDGKRKLASALLTKGVSVREDATFAEIYQAILNIPQKLVIGVQQIPGTISYDYHYHVDGSGNRIHNNISYTPGGCYLQTMHQDYEEIGSHEEERKGTKEEKVSCGCGNTGYDYGDAPCPDCGHHHWDETCREPIKIYVPYTYTVIVKDYGWVVKNYYDLNCTFSDGQILGAHIVYDTNALGVAAMMYSEEDTSADILEESVAQSEDVQAVSESVTETEEVEAEEIEAEEIGMEQVKTEDEAAGIMVDAIEQEEDDLTEETETKQEIEVTEDSKNAENLEDMVEKADVVEEIEEAENLEITEGQEE